MLRDLAVTVGNDVRADSLEQAGKAMAVSQPFVNHENAAVGPIVWNSSTRSTLFEMKSSKGGSFESLQEMPPQETLEHQHHRRKQKQRDTSSYFGWLVPDCLKKQSGSSKRRKCPEECAESAQGFLYWCVTILVLWCLQTFTVFRVPSGCTFWSVSFCSSPLLPLYTRRVYINSPPTSSVLCSNDFPDFNLYSHKFQITTLGCFPPRKITVILLSTTPI